MDVYELFCIFAAKFIDMTIKILSAKNFAIKLKATIQASGRLGFTAETATALDLKSGKFAKFAKKIDKSKKESEKKIEQLKTIQEG